MGNTCYHSLYANKIPSEVNIVAYDELETPLALEGSAQGPVICGVQFHPESFLTGELGLQIIKNWLEKI